MLNLKTCYKMRKHESINFEFIGFPDTHRKIEGVYLFGENAYVGASIHIRNRVISHVRAFLRNAHENKKMVAYLNECYSQNKPIQVTYLSENVNDEQFYSKQIIEESNPNSRFYNKTQKNRIFDVPDMKIYYWMPTELDLCGNKLFLYVLIFNLSENGTKDFTYPLKYICDILDCSKTTAIKTLNDLVKQGLIFKKYVEVDSVTFCHYSINIDKIKDLL